MPDPIPPPGQPKVREKRGVPGCVLAGLGCIGIFGVLVFIGVLVGIFSVRRYLAVGQEGLDKELALLETSAEPATPAALDAWYHLPPGEEDVTDRWIAAFSPLAGPEFELARSTLDLRPTVMREEWPEKEAAREFLKRYEPVLAALHETAARGGAARYPTEFEEGFSAQLHHIQTARDAAKLLALEAHVAAHDGDSPAALRSLQTMLALAKSLERYPQMIVHVVRLALLRLTHESIARVVPSLNASCEELRELKRELERINLDQGVHDALVGERVNGLLAFEHPESVAEEIQVNAEQLQEWAQIWMKRDRAFYLECMRRAMEANREPWPQRLAAVKEIEVAVKQVNEEGPVAKLQHIFSLLLFPAVPSLFTATANGTALRDSARVVLSVECYRQQEGKLPASLEELVPQYLSEVPRDPFDGQPLRYRVHDDRYVVYSVGENRQDDGGEGEQHSHGDTFLRVPFATHPKDPGR